MLNKAKKHTAIIMAAFMLVTMFVPYFGHAERAYALSEKIESYTEITIGTSSTFSFKIGGKTGICMEANGVPSGVGQTCTLTAYTNASSMAKLAYLAKTNYGFDTNKKKYIVSRAASYIAGNTMLNNYLYHEDVNKLVAKAKGSVSVPDTFIAYKANPTNGGQDILCWGTRDNGFIKISKGKNTVSGINSYPTLSGAVYTATSSSGKTIKKMTVTSSGISNTITIPVGIYKIKETTAPVGYRLDPTTYTATVTAGTTIIISSKDTPKTGKAKLRTVSTMPEISNGNKNYSLAGADFEVYDSTGIKKGTFSTTSTGLSNNLALLAGKYTMKQKNSAKGYELRTSLFTFTVTDGKTKEVLINQVPITASLRLKKASSAPAYTNGSPGYSLQGAKYQVTKKGTSINMGTLITDVAGVSNVLKLPLNTYTVSEVTAPKGFKVDTKSYHVAFTTAKQGVTLNVTDEPEDYFIEYKPNGGTGTMNQQQFLFNEKKPLFENQYVADTKFMYWTLLASGEGKRFADKEIFSGLPYVREGKVSLYAQWNTLPTISAPIANNQDSNKVTPFIKGIEGKEYLIIQKGDRFTATNYQTAEDKEDGKLTEKVIVIKNIPLQNGKASESGIFDVTYQVSDSMGEKVIKTIAVLVNEPPEANSPERYFYLDSEMSEQILFEQLTITDREDGKIPYSKESVELVSVNGEKGASFDTAKEGEFEINYKVKDSLKGETEGSFSATVVEEGHSFTDRVSYFPRYIDLDSVKYLDENSIWVTNSEYKKVLMESLTRKSPLYTYKIKL